MRLNNLVGKWSVMGLPTKKYCLPTKKLVGNSVIFSSERDKDTAVPGIKRKKLSQEKRQEKLKAKKMFQDQEHTRQRRYTKET